MTELQSPGQDSDLARRLSALEREHHSLARRYDRLLQLIDLCPHAFYSVGTDGRMIFVNRAAAKFFGRTADDIIGRDFGELRGDPDSAAQSLEQIRSIAERERPHVTPEERLTDEFGVERVYQFDDIPYFDEEFSTKAVLGVATDISDRVRREELARERDRIEHELDIAQAVQRSLLPDSKPDIEGFEIGGWNQAAAKTGGDYFDWAELPDGRMVLSVADVTGHGIGPALIAAICRAYFRASHTIDETVHDMVRRVNELLVSDLSAGRFVTAAVGLLNAATRQVELHSAGHAPILFYHAGKGSVLSTPADGIPLGITASASTVATRTIGFAPGDLLVLVTDGFFEWRRSDGEQFGIERLTHAIEQLCELPPDDLIAGIRDQISEFVGDTQQADDLTAVVIKRTA